MAWEDDTCPTRSTYWNTKQTLEQKNLLQFEKENVFFLFEKPNFCQVRTRGQDFEKNII